MFDLNPSVIFSVIGISVTVFLTLYEVYKVHNWEGGFLGLINSYFEILIDYIALSGMIFCMFFLIIAFGGEISSIKILSVPVFDIFFLTAMIAWIYTAFRIFENLEEMSENYFVK